MKHLTITLICSVLTCLAIIGYYRLAQNSRPASLAISAQSTTNVHSLAGNTDSLPAKSKTQEPTSQRAEHSQVAALQAHENIIIENTPTATQEPLSMANDTTQDERLTVWGLAPTTDSADQPSSVIRKEVVIDRTAIGHLSVGRRMEVPIPQLDTSFTGKVEHMIKHNNGDTTWRGHLEEYGNDYTVVITQGKNNSFASIDTPNGSYHLEATGNKGWVASTADLNSEIDYSRPDFIVPGKTP